MLAASQPGTVANKILINCSQSFFFLLVSPVGSGESTHQDRLVFPFVIVFTFWF